VSGACVFAVCMISPATGALGVSFILASTALFEIACRPPFKVVRLTALLGFALLCPYFLLTPLIHQGAFDWHAGFTKSAAIPWTVFIRGMAGMQISVSTVSTLTASDLRQGLMRLPLPEAVSAILLQIVHQAANLFYETRRIAAAVSVRGASSGFKTALKLMTSLPKVWLPRIITRADRVAAAMEMRGFCERDARAFGSVPMRAVDWAALGLSACLLTAAAALRAGVWR
jgi:energy-coupling factor transporter transmembrane protein EcfT